MLGLPLQIRRASGATPGVGQPDVAFDSAGALHVAFTRFFDEGAAVQVAVETDGGAFATARTVSGAAADAEEPSIAAAPSGGLAIAWTTFASEDSGQVFVGIEPAPGAPVVAVGAPGGGQTRAAQLDIDPATGTLTVAWIRTLDGPSAALVSSQTAGGELEAPTVVSGTEHVSVLDLAFSAAGDAMLTWQRDLADDASDIRAALFDAPRTTPPPPPPPPVAPPALAAPVAPLLLTNFAVDPQCIRYGAPFTGVRRRLSFSFVLSDAATVRLSIQRRLNSGVQRPCPPPVAVKDAAGRLGLPTSVDVPFGLGPGSATGGDEGEAVAAAAVRPRRGVTLKRSVQAGRRRFVLRQAPTTFAPGTYVATVTATAADGRGSATSKVKFWVLLSARLP